MYEGQTATSTRTDKPLQQREQISTITNDTINLLESSIRSLDHLVAKTLGPRPEETNKAGIESSPNMMSDALKLKMYAQQIQYRLEELHSATGYGKAS